MTTTAPEDEDMADYRAAANAIDAETLEDRLFVIWEAIKANAQDIDELKKVEG